MTTSDPEDDLDLTQLSTRSSAANESDDTFLSSRNTADEVVNETKREAIEDHTQLSQRHAEDELTRVSARAEEFLDRTTITGRKDHAHYNSVTSNTTITPDDYASQPQITKRRELRSDAAQRASRQAKTDPERYQIRNEETPDAQAVELGNIAYSQEKNPTPQAPKVPGMRSVALGITVILLVGAGLIGALIWL